MSRKSVAAIALILIVVGVLTLWHGPEGGTAFAAGSIRVGLLFGALWLAWPQIVAFVTRTPRWLLVATGIALVVCAVKPLLLVVAIPLLGVLWLLGPKLGTKADKPLVPAKRPRRRSDPRA